MKHLTVFAGASAGAQTEYRDAVAGLGRALVKRGIVLVYGGARLGLMGLLADAVLAEGGRVIGVIPKALSRAAHRNLTELHRVDSMHERKAVMAELADGFVAVPGGLGTLEEILEMLTWTQLGIHKKPCGLLNVCQYYDGLARFLDHAVDERFVHRRHLNRLVVAMEPDVLLDGLANRSASKVRRWFVPQDPFA